VPHVREANVGRNNRRRRRRSKDLPVEALGFSPGNKDWLEEPHLAVGGRSAVREDEATQSSPQTEK
jgi:hypothetical protein